MPIFDSTFSLKQRLDKTTISLQEYLSLLNNTGKFIIPDYQRGYVWGQHHADNSIDSVTYLVKTILDAYYSKAKDVFLQGVTVHDNIGTYDITLVDGQQRTTFFYLLLHYLGFAGYFQLHYAIREESNTFLKNLDTLDYSRNDDEPYQDLFFFKRTLRIFDRMLSNVDKEELLGFVLNSIHFLLVVIPEEEAKIVFTMMNGNKAKMSDIELIKADLLRCASLESREIKEAENIAIRGRLAREWDNWMYWWNDCYVQKFFRTTQLLGWLLPLSIQSKEVRFQSFHDNLLRGNSIGQTKLIFRKMRLMQKSIEDAYYNAKTYNLMGAILYIRRNDPFPFLRWFFRLDSELVHSRSYDELSRYFNWSIIGVNHEDIVSLNKDMYSDKRKDFLNVLSSDLLFKENYECAYRWLLRQNIIEDNKYDNRKFDFTIEECRSLEHIYPKSKIGHRNDQDIPLDWDDKPLDSTHLSQIKLWREDMKWTAPNGQCIGGTEHCIGNLVLLYKRDNSQFNDADFKRKNELFFTEQDNNAFRSRHLIHTTSVFSNVQWYIYDEDGKSSCWNKEQIARQKYAELQRFQNEYPEYSIES